MVKDEKPDSARSWAICLAACVINTMLSGISRTTGLFYVALIETYGISRLQANLPFTMRNVVRNLGGPLVGAIGQRYGPREVTIVGGVSASLGILLCAFVSDITWITVLWGGMHGLGVALGNTLFQVIVTQYFLKYRATASGLAISGACIGSFVFPLIIEYSLMESGLSGTFLITGAMMMHVIPAGIMMQEPPWIKREIKTSEKADKTKRQGNPPSKSQKISTSKTMDSIQEEGNASIPVAKTVAEIGAKEMLPMAISSGANAAGKSTTYIGNTRNDSGIDNPSFEMSEMKVENRNSKIDEVENFSSKIDLIPTGTEQVLDAEAKRPVVRTRTISIGRVSITIPVEPVGAVQETSIYRGMIKLCRDPMFHMISLSLAAFAMCFDPAITVIVDYLMDKGMKEDLAKYFISMLALGDLFGRLCFGWVTDKKYMSIPKFMMLLQVVQGVCFLLTPIFYSFDILMTLMIVYGLTSGAALVMFPILVGKYLQSVQSLAIGSIQFFSGILSFAVPPVIGYFRDEVGSYDGMFYITGGLSVIVGFCWLFEPMLMRLKSKMNPDDIG